MVKNVIFDLGKVFVGHNWFEFLRTFIPDEEKVEKVREALFGGGRWKEVDREVLPEEVVLDSFIAAAPDCEQEIREFWRRKGDALWKEPYAVDWIDHVRAAGKHIYYLSNYSTWIMKSNLQALNYLPLFEGGIFSCYVHLIKPDPAIYRALTDLYHLNPEECVFVDDHLENVEAAISCGWKAVHFKTYEQAREELDRYL